MFKNFNDPIYDVQPQRRLTSERKNAVIKILGFKTGDATFREGNPDAKWYMYQLETDHGEKFNVFFNDKITETKNGKEFDGGLKEIKKIAIASGYYNEIETTNGPKKEVILDENNSYDPRMVLGRKFRADITPKLNSKGDYNYYLKNISEVGSELNDPLTENTLVEF